MSTDDKLDGTTTPDPVAEFIPGHLNRLADLAYKVEDLAAGFDARLVVEVWDRADHGPVAWVEAHPEDTHPHVRFTAERGD